MSGGGNLIPVARALEHIFALLTPLDHETVPLRRAAGRVLAEPAHATRAQPPFAASSMDGYAVIGDDVRPGAQFTVIGESAAGKGSALPLSSGQAMRIFTGAPVPDGATRVVIQEDVVRTGDTITLNDRLDESTHIRAAGADFTEGQTCFPRHPLTPADLTLLAAMNCAEPVVTRRPSVALIATGDELVMPGQIPGPDQIVASNIFGLAAMIDAAGGLARILPIARDTAPSLRQAFDLAMDADLIVSIGGASVGDHDLVGAITAELGMERAFYKVAMRPGKPLMAGRIGAVAMLGLPGNPVSAMVCGHVFLLPALRVLLGLPAAPAPRRRARLTAPLAANGAREHYMRARLDEQGLSADARQDSALTSVLAGADALIVRPANDGPRAEGDMVEYLPI